MIVGIDPGTKNVGIAVGEIKDNEFILHEFQTIVKKGLGKKGLIEMINEVTNYLMKIKIDLIIIEDYARSYAFNTEEAESVGMLLYRVYTESITENIMYMPIATIKKQVTGDGRATKSKVKQAVKEKFNLKSNISHECDAIAMLMTYSKFINKDMDSKTVTMLDGRIFKVGG